MTDSAVDMADSADTAVRAVSMAITRPVQKAAGLAAGLAHGVAASRRARDWSDAVRVGKEAAARRERDLADELRAAGRGNSRSWTRSSSRSRASGRSARSPGSCSAGVAARHDLTLEMLDDLQLAVESLLEHEEGAERDHRRPARRGGAIEASVGPFERDAIVRARRGGGRRARPAPPARHGRRRRRARPSATDGCWVELRKGYELASGPDAARVGQDPPPPLPRAGRPRGARAADRAVPLARPLAGAALQLPRRAARGSRPDRLHRPDQGDRPLRPRPRRRADHLRDAEHHRRDQAPLPRQGLGGARAARAAGAERPALEADRGADRPARPLAHDRRAREGGGRRGGGGARGARERPRLHARCRSRRAARTRTASSTRSSRSAPRSTSTRSRRTAPCWRPASACSTSASAASCTCASSTG